MGRRHVAAVLFIVFGCVCRCLSLQDISSGVVLDGLCRARLVLGREGKNKIRDDDLNII